MVINWFTTAWSWIKDKWTTFFGDTSVTETTGGSAIARSGIVLNGQTINAVGELASFRTEDSKSYLLENGMIKTMVGGEISHYYNGTSFQDIDFSTSDTPDAPWTHKFSKNKWVVLINSNTSEIRLQHRADANKWIQIANGVDVAVNVEIVNSKYIRVYKNTTNVNYNFLISDKGVKIAYRLNNSSSPSSYNFRVNMSGLTRNGRNIYDGDTKIFGMPDPSLQTVDGGMIDKPVTENISGGVATVSFNPSGLSYPCILDPSFGPVNASADNLLYGGPGENNNYGTYGYLQVGVAGAPGYDSRFIQKFDFSSVADGQSIVSATIDMLCYYNGIGSCTVSLYRLTEIDWTELGSTWNVRYSGTSWTTPGGTYTTTGQSDRTENFSALSWYSWDVKTQVEYWMSNGKVLHALGADFAHEGSGTSYMGFYSLDSGTSSYRPTLSITYTDLAISTSSLASGTVGSAYSQSLSATGGTSPYTWDLSSGTLPDGLNISSGGIISGTPTTAGTSSFTVRVTDADTIAVTKDLSITINASSSGGGLVYGIEFASYQEM